MLISILKDVDLQHFNDSKDYIEYSKDVQDVYRNFEEYNPDRKPKVLIVFNGMIADMISNRNPNQIACELLLEEEK